MPGFRPGKVPMGMVKKMYGTQAKADEVNKLLGESLMNYIRENNVNMLGEPMASEKQVAQDIETQEDFEFIFDVALAPEFTVECSAADKVAYYDIQVSEEQVEEQVKQLAQRGGHTENVETYSDRDIVRGVLAELDETGMPKEGGLQVEMASLMPAYFKNEEQKAFFATAKTNDVITFCPAKAYEGSDAELAALLKIKKEETAQYQGNFSFQVNEISHFVAAELNQEFFDQVYGEGAVKSEEEFKNKVKENLQNQFVADSDYKFLLDVRAYLEEKVGQLEFPNEMLKKIMLANNADKGEDFVNENYDKSIVELKWHLIKEQLVKANDIKVNDEDVKKTAIQATRFQFAQYGMANIPDEYLEQYASEMLKKKEQVQGLVERCIDEKLTAALKNVVTLEHKSVTVEEFNKMFEKA
jgi:trigger factor